MIFDIYKYNIKTEVAFSSYAFKEWNCQEDFVQVQDPIGICAVSTSTKWFW